MYRRYEDDSSFTPRFKLRFWTDEKIVVRDFGKGGIVNTSQNGYVPANADDAHKPPTDGVCFAERGIAAGLLLPYIGSYESLDVFNKKPDCNKNCYAFQLGKYEVVNGDPSLLPSHSSNPAFSFVKINEPDRHEYYNLVAFQLTPEEQTGIFNDHRIVGQPGTYPTPYNPNRANVFFCLIDPNIQLNELLVSYGKSFGGNRERQIKDDHMIQIRKVIDSFITAQPVLSIVDAALSDTIAEPVVVTDLETIVTPVHLSVQVASNTVSEHSEQRIVDEHTMAMICDKADGNEDTIHDAAVSHTITEPVVVMSHYNRQFVHAFFDSNRFVGSKTKYKKKPFTCKKK